MKHEQARFELRLSADQRRELEELGRELGLSSSDLARLGIRWLLAHPGVLLGRSAGGRSAADGATQ